MKSFKGLSAGLVMILVFFIATSSTLLKVLWLVVGFFFTMLLFYQYSSSVILFAVLLLFVSGCLVLNLWLATYFKYRTNSMMNPLVLMVPLVVVFLVEASMDSSLKQMESFSYLLESNISICIFFVVFLSCLLLMSSMLLNSKLQIRSW